MGHPLAGIPTAVSLHCYTRCSLKSQLQLRKGLQGSLAGFVVMVIAWIYKFTKYSKILSTKRKQK